MSEGDKIIEDVAKGVTKGVIESSSKAVSVLLQKFLNKELAFVRDPEEIKEIKEKRKLPEYATFTRYVTDPQLRIEFQMGLRLRDFEKTGNDAELKKLRTKLFKSPEHGKKGLHVAEFVGIGLFIKTYGFFLENSNTDDRLRYEITNFFANIDKFTSFVQSADSVVGRATEISSKINVYSPKLFVICGKKMFKKATQIKNNAMKKITGYISQSYKSEFKDRQIFLIINRDSN